MIGRMLMVIAWPAFLAACLLEVVVFAVVDPLDLRWSGQALGWSRPEVYTLAFFVFWLATLAGCGLSSFLRLAPGELKGAGEVEG